jgi:molecular chaperone GrpE
MQRESEPHNNAQDTLAKQHTGNEISQGTTDTVDLNEKLAATQKQADEYLNLLRRTLADFMNYKRRASLEHAELQQNARITVIEQLLPLLDDLDRALDLVPNALMNDPWVQGLLMLGKSLEETLTELGIQKIDQPGEPFDPHRHDALLTQADNTVQEEIVKQIILPGYLLDKRVIRPAQVVVAMPTQPRD